MIVFLNSSFSVKNKVGRNGNIAIKGFNNSKKVTSSGARPDDHWPKRLLLVCLTT